MKRFTICLFLGGIGAHRFYAGKEVSNNEWIR